MLSKKALEELIIAWPDENGHSSNPRLFEQWKESERLEDARVIQDALGLDRIHALSQSQVALLEQVYAELLNHKHRTEISDIEIIKLYEQVINLN